MTTNIQLVLPRCWSPKSAGDLSSEKSQTGVREHSVTVGGLLQESQGYRNLYDRTPTAFVSTTSNFLRALHIAFQRIYNGKDARHIKIAFITSKTDAQTRIYSARDFAIRSGSSEEEADNFGDEYLFLWNVPDDNVIHVISIDFVIRRAFALPRVRTRKTFPNLSDLRRASANHTDQLAPFERGYSCVSDACMSGLRVTVHRIASQMPYPRSDDYCGGRHERSRGGRVPRIRNRLPRGTYDETIMEIGWEMQNCQHAGSLQARLRGEKLKIMSYRLRRTNRIETAYQHIGL
jgi:hypothetical protein